MRSFLYWLNFDCVIAEGGGLVLYIFLFGLIIGLIPKLFTREPEATRITTHNLRRRK